MLEAQMQGWFLRKSLLEILTFPSYQYRTIILLNNFDGCS
jgi:hypothetical protein